MPDHSETIERIADARLAEIVARFGQRFTSDQSEVVRNRIMGTLKQASVLRSAPLTNGDEPEIIFMPARGKE